MTISIYYNGLYLISCCYIFTLIIIYSSVVIKRRLLVTILMIFQVFALIISLNSNFLVIILLLLVILPFAITMETKKSNICTFCGVFFTLSTIIGIQSIGYPRIYQLCLIFSEYIKRLLNFNIFGYLQRLVHSPFVNEIQAIGKLIVFIEGFL